jgi:hypothetical protein
LWLVVVVRNGAAAGEGLVRTDNFLSRKCQKLLSMIGLLNRIICKRVIIYTFTGESVENCGCSVWRGVGVPWRDKRRGSWQPQPLELF